MNPDPKQPFDADNISVDNWPMLRVRKKPIEAHATQLNFPEGFVVTTLEGMLRGKPGDFLIIGVDGEKYPIDQEIFARTYDVISSDPCPPPTSVSSATSAVR